MHVDRTVEPARAGMITAEQAARLLMLSDERIRQLSAEGYIPKADRNSYPLVGTVQGYIRFLRDEDRRSSKVKADSDLKKARTVQIERWIEREEAKLVPKAEAVAYTEAVVGMLIAGLESLPERDALGAEDRRRFDAAMTVMRSGMAKAIAEHPLSKAEQ